MIYTLQFEENEVNFIWSALQACNISGKDAPALTSIFVKMQEQVGMQNAIREQEAAEQANQVQPEGEAVEEEKPETVEPEVEVESEPAE